MEVIVILLLSVFFQLGAAYFSLKLIRVTGRKTAWLFVSVAIVLMSLRRLYNLYFEFTGDFSSLQRVSFEVLGFVISLLMFVGVMMISPIFEKIKRADEEKASLLREINHRVKNNLAIVSSLLKLERGNLKDQSDVSIFLDCENRIKSILLIHEILYQTQRYRNVDINSYLTKLVASIKATFGNPGITMVIDVRDVQLSVDCSLLCGLVINELVTNAYKHAFPGGRSGTIAVSLKRLNSEEGTYSLEVRDDGVGLPYDFNPADMKTLGLDLVTNIVERQMMGKCEFLSQGGTTVKIRFMDVREVA